MTTRSLHAAQHLVLLALLTCCIALAQAADPAPQLAGTALRDALVRGGYVLYFRHGATDFGQNDDKMTGYEDCAQQRKQRWQRQLQKVGYAMREADDPDDARVATQR